MIDHFEQTLDVDCQVLLNRLKEEIIEDTKDNVRERNKEGIYMGKVGAKKFYFLYKPPYMPTIRFCTMMNGDLSESSEKKTRLRYRFQKSGSALISAILIMLVITVLVFYSQFSNQLNLAAQLCLWGFWVLCMAAGLCSLIPMRMAKERLLSYMKQLSIEK